MYDEYRNDLNYDNNDDVIVCQSGFSGRFLLNILLKVVLSTLSRFHAFLPLAISGWPYKLIGSPLFSPVNR
jgi:hypothetical protein